MSFLILVLAMSSMVSNYSIDTKKTLMDSSARYTSEIIDTYRVFDNTGFSGTVEKYASRIRDALEEYASTADSVIFVMEPDGTLLVVSSHTYDALVGSVLLPADGHQRRDQQRTPVRAEQSGKHLLRKAAQSFSVVRGDGGNVEGLILVSSPSVGNPLLIGTMQKTMIAASLWVLLAAIIAVYVISQRISEPIKSIGKAAKSFALGDFSVRVDVTSRDEVGQLAVAFNNMAASLAKTDELRSAFVANVSHDLRTPMTVISGYVDGILDGTIPEEKRDYYLGIISGEVRRLSRLVNSLLEISRMQSGDRKLTMTNFNITEKARQVLLSFEQKIDEKHFEIDFNSPEDIFRQRGHRRHPSGAVQPVRQRRQVHARGGTIRFHHREA